ncbi:O-antigen ligase like membrane protein [Chitinophaga terrae (ex Kim and Jung 2007)]|uniref:O-antigen ligase like membrane protein n=1 Tax=Chitinophaga terrae (ex Kim and Jung 2007) TaxID=408074 RepID=A0A1H4CCH8_9BACT|nr:O-antigen ligase family protein [Chitinophaga terrae (ex Kim and Jung 2007)]GEP88890.1 membrane protein [Chitinophaga terrae (ex Kim and Jung 2007)]SEA58048.1 O-antigen ligase like membrane protein [Chitinophaga terrae (ex Kim and Jung 2007)]
MPAFKKTLSRVLFYILWFLSVPAVAYLASQDLKLGIALVAGIMGLALCLVCVVNYKLGYYVVVTIGLTVPVLEKLSGNEQNVGVIIDGLLLCTLLGCFIRRGDPTIKKVQVLKDPLLMSLILYLLVQVMGIANPYGHNIAAWVVMIRVFVRGLLFLYLGLNVFNNMEDIRRFIKFWIAIGTLAGIYACLQQHFGLMPYEKAFIAKFPARFSTTMIQAGIRIFSFMSDAASFGIIMACNVILCTILLTTPKYAMKPSQKFWLVFAIVFQLLGLGYSGTRTGYVMVPAGLMLFFLANLHNKNTILIAMAFGFLALVVLFGPFHSNPTIVRVRTAFLGKKDESVNVRDRNRHKIQPYIYTHPIGGGLMTTGYNGEVFYPGHELANFMTDNGYLRAILETGWVSIFLLAGNFFFLIQIAIVNYFKLKNDLDKLIMLGIAASMLGMALAEYAQDANTLVESSLMFYAFMAIVLKAKYLYVLNNQS